MSTAAVAAWRTRRAATGPGDPRAPGEWWLIGGVAAELARRLAVPVGFIRGLLFLASFIQPAVVYTYMAAALLVPHAGRRRPSWANVIAVARVGFAFGLLWSVSAGGVSVNPGLFDQGPGVWVTQLGVILGCLAALVATGVPASARDEAGDRRTVLTAAPLVAGTVLLAVGVVLAPGIAWEPWLAVLAVCGGIGVVLGVGRGRDWGPSRIVPAAVLAVAAVVLATAGVRLEGGVGDRRVVAVSAAAIEPVYRRAVGDLRIDLTGLRPSAAAVTVTIRASVGIGDLRVDVPPGAQVSAVERVGRGQIRGAGPPREGFDLHRTLLVAAEDPRTGRAVADPGVRVQIAATVGIGAVEVRRIGPSEDTAL